MVFQKIHHKPFIIIFVFLFLFSILSGCVNIKCSYIPETFLSYGWYENLSLRNTGLHFMGTEKWCSSVYELKGKYPASLTVTTIKSLLLSDEDEINKKIQDIIEDNFKDTIEINISTKIIGERVLNNSHKTKYTIYDGFNIQKQIRLKIIGEVWNCGISGSSVICIGIAHISSEENTSLYNTENWQKIVFDPSGNIENLSGKGGLIYNVKCH